jgi:hypothetical protein
MFYLHQQTGLYYRPVCRHNTREVLKSQGFCELFLECTRSLRQTLLERLNFSEETITSSDKILVITPTRVQTGAMNLLK